MPRELIDTGNDKRSALAASVPTPTTAFWRFWKRFAFLLTAVLAAAAIVILFAPGTQP